MCHWTLLKETRKEAIAPDFWSSASPAPSSTYHDACKNIHRMPEILILHEQTETSKRKISRSCFRGITVLTKFKLAVQLHFLLFLRISFGSFIHVPFQHEDVVLGNRSWTASHRCSPWQNKFVSVHPVFVARAEHWPGTQMSWPVWRQILVTVGRLLSTRSVYRRPVSNLCLFVSWWIFRRMTIPLGWQSQWDGRSGLSSLKWLTLSIL